jgi:hypothetical protein
LGRMMSWQPWKEVTILFLFDADGYYILIQLPVVFYYVSWWVARLFFCSLTGDLLRILSSFSIIHILCLSRDFGPTTNTWLKFSFQLLQRIPQLLSYVLFFLLTQKLFTGGPSFLWAVPTCWGGTGRRYQRTRRALNWWNSFGKYKIYFHKLIIHILYSKRLKVKISWLFSFWFNLSFILINFCTFTTHYTLFCKFINSWITK